MLHRDISAIRLSGEHDRRQAGHPKWRNQPIERAAWYARYALDRLADDPGRFHPGVRSHIAAACVEHEAAANALGLEHDQVTKDGHGEN